MLLISCKMKRYIIPIIDRLKRADKKEHLRIPLYVCGPHAAPVYDERIMPDEDTNKNRGYAIIDFNIDGETKDEKS